MNESHQLRVWTKALNLPEYEVVHFAERDGVRHFSLVPTFCGELCPDCSRMCERVHQKRWIEDVVDLPFADQPVRLKVRVVQYHCEHCGGHFTPKTLFLTPGVGGKATARFVEQAAEMIRHADIKGAAEFFGVPEKTLERWYYEWAEFQCESADEESEAKPIRSLGIDELSLKKSTVNTSR